MYLQDEMFAQITKQVKLVEFDENYRINDFDSGLADYNEFLVKLARECIDQNICRVYLLINKVNADVIGYMTLSNDSIKLSDNEKEVHGLDSIPFRSVPAIKIGQLATDVKYRESCKGYGSYMIELAIGFAVKMGESEYGTICRFITVDVDTKNDSDDYSLTNFYIKNGFEFNEQHNRDKRKLTKSMRLDIFSGE